ncbi:PRD domain-containing protein [Brachyspira aalborgi]|jgi:transcriptional regulatory protein LevR|uniref:PRD domain-containing protein n=2 Tax=Brachyspira aalborgi TaxID=29522 RepID=A0A5C8F4Q9_9SPIR|nr:PRD domain-containing protein [Brachyspira aalborgi]TXJ14283.1 PRD domain-containing protein [Brachyspira aalborgi]TXJ19061.1 PRD domain-containing protein [Brachyspira aalborgi]TXJ25185.1 PRD domain-containing protein [Brachyspira aalborgi]TXJ31099.1 PRD domain-containing protein [Brachyspira aalborgi]TXJ40182.1 PRD domain-containing protein [Brachyspira aalborgi]
MDISMTLEDRLEILENSSVIDSDIKVSMLKIISVFKDKYKIILTEENGSMLITHISMALVRIRSNQDIKEIDNSAYEEVIDSEYFQEANNIYKDLENILNIPIPEYEKKYILVNICVILENYI